MLDLEQISQVENAERTQEFNDASGYENEAYKFAKATLEDSRELLNIIPRDLPQQFWAVFDKEFKLTNLNDKDDVRRLMYLFDIAKLDFKMSQNPRNVKFSNLKDWDMLEMKFFASIKRSTGGMLRERGLLATQHQIKQLITNESEQPHGGLLSKIGGAFTGRG